MFAASSVGERGAGICSDHEINISVLTPVVVRKTLLESAMTAGSRARKLVRVFMVVGRWATMFCSTMVCLG